MNMMHGMVLLAPVLALLAATATAQVSTHDERRCEMLREQIAGLQQRMSPNLIYLPPALVDQLENFKGEPSHPVSRQQLGELVREMQLKEGWNGDEVREFMTDTMRYNLRARRATQKHLVKLNAELHKLETGSAAPQAELAMTSRPLQAEAAPAPGGDGPAFSVGEAERAIVGDWVFAVADKDNRIYVTFLDDDPNNQRFQGILMLDNLKHFSQGDIMFEVRPVPDTPGMFRGKELGYDDEGVRRDEPLTLRIRNGTMEYSVPGQSLTMVRPTQR